MGPNKINLALEYNNTLALDLTLGQCLEFWLKRYTVCRALGFPEGHVLPTKTIKNILAASDDDRPKFITAATLANESFLNDLEREIDPFLKDIHSAVELGCGPCLFLRRLKRKVNHVFGVEVVPELVRDMNSKLETEPNSPKIFQGQAHEFARLLKGIKVGAVFAIRASLHWPQDEWDETWDLAQEALPEGGLIVISEMFKNDLPPKRAQNPGTWYRYIAEFDERLHHMKRLYLSLRPFLNESDPVRVAVYQKPVR